MILKVAWRLVALLRGYVYTQTLVPTSMVAL
jgi:hypothetical protein